MTESAETGSGLTRGRETGYSDSEDWLANTILEAAEVASIGVFVTAASDGLRNVFANRAAAGILGKSQEELLTIDPFAMLTGGEQSRLDSFVAAFASTGAFPPTVETTIRRPDGSEAFLEVGFGGIAVGEAPGVVSFVTDVTSRMLALDSLKRSEERFRSVVESIPEAIFITEGTSLTYANPAFVELIGVDPSQDGPLDVLDFVHPDDVSRLKEQSDGLLAGPATHAEYRLRARDGSFITLEVAAIGADFDGKRAVLFLGHDVTEQKQLEGQILQADRLAVLGTLAAGMAHAINNPLSYTLLNLEHVARRMRDMATEHDYYSEARVRLAEAHDGADRVAKVVRQMRALSRARPSAPGPVDIRSVLEGVLAMIGNEIRYRGQLVTRFDPIPRVWASEGELEQAFLGLLLNVARSRPEESSQGREIRLSLGKDGTGAAVVTVSDDGLPMSPEVRARLFDPFSEAMGLGLAMCHAIFTSLGGQLVAESGPGSGTTFRVTLPASKEETRVESSRSSIPATPTPDPSPARARVLVIDDDPGVARTLRVMLEANHEVKSVESAREGLRLLLSDQNFDIVFCDLVMPEVSGIDLYCALELNRPESTKRVVFMTGAAFTPDAERFLSRVPNPRIEKPFSLARVEQLLAQAVRARNAPPTA
jgi:two-component system cell cycle sensor histidine kinase/response regulator CckA